MTKLDYDAQKEHRFRFRFVERKTILILGDFLAGLLGLVFALYLWGSQSDWLGFSIRFLLERVPGWFYLLPLVWLFLIMELYDIRKAGSLSETLQGIATAALVGSILYLAVYFSSSPESLPRIGVAAFVLGAVVFTFLWRYFYIRVLTSEQFLRRVLVVGAGISGNILLESFSRLDPKPFQLVGLIDDDPAKQDLVISGYPVLGTGPEMLEIIKENDVTDIIVSITGVIRGKTFQALLDAQGLGVEIVRMPVAYEDLNHRVPIRILEADWILRSFVDDTGVSGYYNFASRLIDILGGMVGTLLLLIILPFVGAAVIIDSGLPVFYLQKRMGRLGKPYQIIKFRTMIQDAERDGEPQWARENDQRITPVGRFLRKTHLDEFPQFINVLKGEMSLVGPRSERPMLVEELQKQVPFYRARLLVKPGVTGWAQINYGYPETIDGTIDKLEYDLYYIKHRSILLDLRILLRTPATVFGLKGK